MWRAGHVQKPVTVPRPEIHTKKIIHADLKPENILFDRNVRIVIGDFGLALQIKAIKYYGIWGTPTYRSPEQLRQNEQWDQTVDYFVCGVIFGMMVTGFHPFNFSRSNTDDEIEQNIKSSSVAIQTSDTIANDFLSSTLCEAPIRLNDTNILSHPFIAPLIDRIMSSYRDPAPIICTKNTTHYQTYTDNNFPKMINGIDNEFFWGSESQISTTTLIIHEFEFGTDVLFLIRNFNARIRILQRKMIEQ